MASSLENNSNSGSNECNPLQNQVDILTREVESLREVCKSNNVQESLLSRLNERESNVNEMSDRLKKIENQLQVVTIERNILQNANSELQDRVALLEDIIQAKDTTVMSLTNQLYDMETNTGSGSVTSMSTKERKEFDGMKDSVRAYQTQNDVLNKEVIQVTELRSAAESKAQRLQLKVHEWEAKCCQIQSKLLSLLKELNQAEDDEGVKDDEEKEQILLAKNENIKALVNRLLDDCSLDIPLSWKRGNRSRMASSISDRSVADYDDLGFNNRVKVRYSSGDSTEDTKVNLAWKSRWDTYFAAVGGHGIRANEELKELLRTGVPQEYRPKVWKSIIDLRVAKDKKELATDYYQRLSAQTPTKPAHSYQRDITMKQIELDLLRTLPNNRHFENLESEGTCRLRNILVAFSRHNPTVGYCQGLNRLAAVALLMMPEEDAFWCLVAIVEHIMPREYYSQNLLGAHVDQYVFRDLLAEKPPRVHYHMEQFGIEISLFSWFLTCFVDNIPVDVYLRIWDVFLYEGSKVLFRFALAFLKMHEEEILRLQDSMMINTFLRTLGERNCDVRTLCKIAFSLLNPFPMSKVKTKRAYHTRLVKGELAKLDEIRRALPERRERVGSDSGQSD